MPAQVGFDSVRSSTSAPASRLARSILVSGLGCRSQWKREENTSSILAESQERQRTGNRLGLAGERSGELSERLAEPSAGRYELVGFRSSRNRGIVIPKHGRDRMLHQLGELAAGELALMPSIQEKGNLFRSDAPGCELLAALRRQR